MNKKKKSGLSGKRITRKQALRGLSHPDTWEAEAKELKREFKRKPGGFIGACTCHHPGTNHCPLHSKKYR